MVRKCVKTLDGGWMGGWVDGGERRVKDCLQQSKIAVFNIFLIKSIIIDQFRLLVDQKLNQNRRFEYHLDRISSRPRLDRISLSHSMP